MFDYNKQDMIDFKEFKFENFKMEQLDEIVSMVIESFEHNNVFSKQGLESREQLQFRIRVQIHLFFESQQKYNTINKTNRDTIKVLTHKGKVVAVGMACDLHLFFQDMLTLIDPEDPYIQIFKYVNPNHYPPGTAVMGSLFAVRKQYMNFKLGNLFMYHVYPQFKAQGIQCVLGTSTNPISVKVALKFGGKVVREQTIERNGKKAVMYLCQMKVKNMNEKFIPKL